MDEQKEVIINKYQSSFNPINALNVLLRDIKSVEDLNVLKITCKKCFKNETLTLYEHYQANNILYFLEHCLSGSKM